jgi:hypothetical protein
MRFLCTVILVSCLGSSAAISEESGQLGAHDHGVGALNIALENDRITMEFEAPGADIVGFEHAASTDEHRTEIENAVAKLAKPLQLFAFPAAAGCVVTRANVELHGGKEDDHAEHEAHGDEDSEKAGHTEFHAEYDLTCASPDAITRIDFSYFIAFPNALELNVQLISDRGATAFDVERGNPVLDLAGAI